MLQVGQKVRLKTLGEMLAQEGFHLLPQTWDRKMSVVEIQGRHHYIRVGAHELHLLGRVGEVVAIACQGEEAKGIEVKLVTGETIQWVVESMIEKM